MLTIDDMFELNTENVKNFFIEDIETFFSANHIYFTRDFSFMGKTGSFYTYEFHFQRSQTKPERFCKAINKINEPKRNMAIFNWLDIQERRCNDEKLIIMLNDENKVKDDDLKAFSSYDIIPVLFSERDNYKDLFHAS